MGIPVKKRNQREWYTVYSVGGESDISLGCIVAVANRRALRPENVRFYSTLVVFLFSASSISSSLSLFLSFVHKQFGL